jgi:hypothetical protein
MQWTHGHNGIYFFQAECLDYENQQIRFQSLIEAARKERASSIIANSPSLVRLLTAQTEQETSPMPEDMLMVLRQCKGINSELWCEQKPVDINAVHIKTGNLVPLKFHKNEFWVSLADFAASQPEGCNHQANFGTMYKRKMNKELGTHCVEYLKVHGRGQSKSYVKLQDGFLVSLDSTNNTCLIKARYETASMRRDPKTSTSSEPTPSSSSPFVPSGEGVHGTVRNKE